MILTELKSQINGESKDNGISACHVMDDTDESRGLSCSNIIHRQIFVLLAYDLQQKKMYKIANRVIFLLSKLGSRGLISVLTHCFDILADNIQAGVKRKDIRDILGYCVLHFQDYPDFYRLVTQFFQTWPEFPEKVLSFLSFYVSFTLVVGAIDSRHSVRATEYLRRNLVPEMGNCPNLHLPETSRPLFLKLQLPIIPPTLFDIPAETEDEKPVLPPTIPTVSISICEVLGDYSIAA
jgi:hypothetical protein